MNDVAKAVQILKSGGLVAFPTETVYGLGADATNARAVRRIFEAKGRSATNPVIVHVADESVARRYVGEWPEEAGKLARRFWPGENPLGKRIGFQPGPGHEVIGVARTGKYRNLREEPLPYMYLPLGQNYRPRMTLFVRAAGGAAGTVAGAAIVAVGAALARGQLLYPDSAPQ